MIKSDEVQLTDFLTIDEVCKWLKVSRKTLEKLRNDFGLKSVKIGKSIRFSRSEVIDWINLNNKE